MSQYHRVLFRYKDLESEKHPHASTVLQHTFAPVSSQQGGCIALSKRLWEPLLLLTLSLHSRDGQAAHWLVVGMAVGSLWAACPGVLSSLHGNSMLAR